LTRAIAYDEEHRVVSIQDGSILSQYTYGADRQRIKKTEGGTTTYYFFANYEEVWAGGSQVEARTYYLANDQKIAQRIIQGGSDTLSYVHADHLGSSVKLTDETGQVIQTIAYDPYGETALSEGATEPAYQYTGQEKDAETGLYYYGARYYDPELGRFIQGDSLLDGLNRYAYGHNNPLKYTDPTGNYVVDPDTNECFGGDCDHYPGYEDYDPATGDEDNDGDDTDDDWALYRQVINNILGESWEIKGVSDIFLYDFEGLTLAVQYVHLRSPISFSMPDALLVGTGGSAGAGWKNFGVGWTTGIEELYNFNSKDWSTFIYQGPQGTYKAELGANAAFYGGAVWNVEQNADYAGPFNFINFTFAAGHGVTATFAWTPQENQFLGGALTPGNTKSLTGGYAPGVKFSVSSGQTQYTMLPDAETVLEGTVAFMEYMGPKMIDYVQETNYVLVSGVDEIEQETWEIFERFVETVVPE
jgi:RHS repeat-associated protein